MDGSSSRNTARRIGCWLVPAMLLVTACARQDGAGSGFTVDRLAEGVLLYRPVGDGAQRTNSLVIERQDGLLVVESQPTPEAARALLAAIAEQSAKPVRYLVLSHPHAESAGGAGAFPESTLLVANEALRDTLNDPAWDFSAEMPLLAGSDAGFTEPPRRAPTLLVTGRITLDDPEHPVHVLAVPPAHAPGSLVVILPEPEILYAGPLLFPDRNPYAKDGNVQQWLNMLNHFARERYRLLLPLRGPAIDSNELRQLRDALAWLSGQVESAFVDLTPVAEIPSRVLAVPGTGERLALDADPSFARILIERMVAERVIERQKRRRPIP